jgi:2-iminobutanoate/2-iminopropanoate deaminase
LKSAIASPDVPQAVGPYSPAVRAGQLLFVSGQIPVNPATGEMVHGDVAAQTRRVLENIRLLVTAAGLSLQAVVRTTVYLSDLGDFRAMNDAYSEFFDEPYPARSTVQAARLPRDARVEIDAIAIYDSA